MGDIQKVKEELRRKYGIKTHAELREAIRKQPKLNISIFVGPLQRKSNDERPAG